MILKQNKYELNVKPVTVMEDLLNCEQYISNTFNISGFLKCQVTFKAIKILFNPSEELNEKLIFQELSSILQQIGIAFISMTIRQFSFDLGRTLVSAVIGGALGTKAGLVGTLIGVVVATYLEQELLCWKDVCKCDCDRFGNLSMIDLRNNDNGNGSFALTVFDR